MGILRSDIHKQLATAAGGGKLAVMRKLLRKGARPDVGPCTAVWEAVSGGQLEALALLIEAQPKQDALDGALHFATMRVHRDMVQLLLDAGARVTFDLDDPKLFEWPKHFGDTERPEAIRRMLVAHMTAKRLESAMDDGAAQERNSDCGMAPL